VNLRGIKEHKFFRPALGAGLAVLCGMLLLQMPAAQSWADASYDYLFRFQSGRVTNKVVVVQMDESSAQALNTERIPWSRSLHTNLLNLLTEAPAALVVFDVRFLKEKDREVDEALAAAMRRHGRVVLAGDFAEINTDGATAGDAIIPHARFLEAATNWGIAKLFPIGEPIRMFLPPAADDHTPDLPSVAARLMGAKLDQVTDEMWIRYYGGDGGLDRLSYQIALKKLPDYFRNRVVFIGSKPRNGDPDEQEVDKFKTPYARWEKDGAVGGVEILATQFLNLMNNDWLKRMPRPAEYAVLIDGNVSVPVDTRHHAGCCVYRRSASGTGWCFPELFHQLLVSVAHRDRRSITLRLGVGVVQSSTGHGSDSPTSQSGEIHA
jgi:hypothetical protein